MNVRVKTNTKRGYQQKNDHFIHRKKKKTAIDQEWKNMVDQFERIWIGHDHQCKVNAWKISSWGEKKMTFPAKSHNILISQFSGVHLSWAHRQTECCLYPCWIGWMEQNTFHFGNNSQSTAKCLIANASSSISFQKDFLRLKRIFLFQ